MNEREIACDIIMQFVKTKQRLDEIVLIQLAKVQLSGDEIRHIKNITSGAIRHCSLLDWYTSKLFKGKFSKLLPKIKIVLRLGLYEILFMEHIPYHATVNEYVNLTKKIVNERSAKLVNAILRSFLRQREDLERQINSYKNENLSTRYSFPPWMIKRWTNEWGIDFTEKLCDAFNQIPEFKIRVNQKKISIEDFKKTLIENDVLFAQSKKFKEYFKIKQLGRIRESGLFEKGWCSVQDESAAIPVKLLNLTKGDSLLDVCAAPGGKFTQALENASELNLAVAVDENLMRLQKVKENLTRLDLSGYVVAADAKNLPFKIKFNKILIDAPCSGQGVISKHPDIKWRRSEKEIKEFSKLQKQILQNVSGFLNKAGQMVYSTCSIDKSENEEVVAALDNKYSVSEILPFDKIKSEKKCIKTFPSIDKMDGSFACLIKIAGN